MLGLGLCLLAAPAFARDTDVARLDSLFAHAPHARFEWSAADSVSDRATLRLPVSLGDSLEGWMQLDTGLDVTQIAASLADSLGWERAGLWARVPRLDVGDMAFGPAWVLPGEGAGRWETRGDGKDDGGTAVASSAYFCRAERGSDVQIRKPVLVR